MAAFKTKFTVGLLTVEPCDPGKDATIDVEVKSAEVLAIEQAARDAIKAKKKAKKVARQKSRSASPSAKKKVTRKKSKDPAPPPTEDLEAKKRAEEEAARKKAEEEEAARKKAEEEEAARKAAEEEAARLAAEAEIEEPEPSMTGEIDDPEPSLEPEPEPEPPQPTREKPQRRISFFPASGDNTGLTEAIRKYGNDVPFDWEEPEWTKEHVDLKHTSTMNKTYGWEKPEWAKNLNLKKTDMGDKVKEGACLNRVNRSIHVTNRKNYVKRAHSMSEKNIVVNSKEYFSTLPEWAKKNILKSTELGEAARQGLSLSVPLAVIRALAYGDGSEADLGFESSFASLSASKNLNFDYKPEWAVNPSLKPTDAGFAVRQGANLALPVVGIREVVAGEKTPNTEFSPNSSFATLNASQKNIGWEKPAWTKMALKKTGKADQMKTTGTLYSTIKYKEDE